MLKFYMLPYKRSERVSRLIKKEIADILMRRLKDPRLGFVSVVDVELTGDLKIARVYMSILKDEERGVTMEILNSAKAFIRSELAKRIKMKFIPSLEFREDTTITYASKIEALLKRIRS